jgi:hypothetical protein
MTDPALPQGYECDLRCRKIPVDEDQKENGDEIDEEHIFFEIPVSKLENPK